MKKIAILGGTFNPIHNGHLLLAERAVEQFGLDECWLMPAPNPPHKTGRVTTDYALRLEMVRLAAAADPHLKASDFEAHRTGKSYTSDTVTELDERFSDCRFYFVCGADSFYEFDTWHEPGTILQHVSLIVAARSYEKEHCTLKEQASFLQAKYGGEILFIDAPVFDVSSEQIRALFQRGEVKAAEQLIPPSVADHIREHGLYREV